MGFNSTVLILNDVLHDISADPKFGEKVHQAIAVYGVQQARYPWGQVIAQHHADYHSVNIIGGNTGECLGHASGIDEQLGDWQVDVLRQVAHRLGYRLVKQSRGKRNG
jgi:hypothetical protein